MLLDVHAFRRTATKMMMMNQRQNVVQHPKRQNVLYPSVQRMSFSLLSIDDMLMSTSCSATKKPMEPIYISSDSDEDVDKTPAPSKKKAARFAFLILLCIKYLQPAGYGIVTRSRRRKTILMLFFRARQTLAHRQAVKFHSTQSWMIPKTRRTKLTIYWLKSRATLHMTPGSVRLSFILFRLYVIIFYHVLYISSNLSSYIICISLNIL